jgi:hypothetical protein
MKRSKESKEEDNTYMYIVNIICTICQKRKRKKKIHK